MMVLACHGALRTAARRDPVTGRGRGAKFGGHDALTVFSAEKLCGDGPLPGPDAQLLMPRHTLGMWYVPRHGLKFPSDLTPSVMFRLVRLSTQGGAPQLLTLCFT